MGAEIKPGAAAPAASEANQSAGGEFSRETMERIFARKGRKLTVPDAKPGESQNGGAKAEGAAGEAAAGVGGDAGEGAAAAAEAAEKKKLEAAGAAAGAGEGEGAGAGEGGGEGAAAGAGEGEGAAAGEGEAAAGAAGEEPDEHAAETERVVKTKLKDLPEAQRKVAQSIINERIGAITGKAKAETDRLGARVVELTTELETTRADKGPVIVQGLHPAFLAISPAEIDRISDELDRHEDMLEQVKDTGIEADEARGIPAYTADQIRNRLREIRRERERVLPQARTHLQKRAEAEAALKTSYPALFDARTEDYRIADQLRKQLPELRRMPDAAAFVAKFVLGAKALAELQKTPEEKKRGAATPAAAAGGGRKPNPPPLQRKAPRAPGDGAAAHGSVLDDPRHQQPDATSAVKTFTENRTSREALKGAVRALVFR